MPKVEGEVRRNIISLLRVRKKFLSLFTKSGIRVVQPRGKAPEQGSLLKNLVNQPRQKARESGELYTKLDHLHSLVPSAIESCRRDAVQVCEIAAHFLRNIPTRGRTSIEENGCDAAC